MKLDDTAASFFVRCRSSHEERGLKCDAVEVFAANLSRSSHEERGLKFVDMWVDDSLSLVAPRMRSVD